MFKVSVLIPVYNVKDYIERCLRSVFENTIITDCEVIILNDKTQDNSFDIAKEIISQYPELKSNIKLLEHDKNTGIAQVRNDLLKEATGEYFIFIDSDDYVENVYLEKLYCSAKNNDADIVECDYIIHDLRGNVKEVYCNVASTPYDCINAKLDGINSAYLFIKLVKLSIVKDNNIQFIPGMNLCEDEFFTYNVYCYSKKINYVSDFLYHYVLNKDSITRTLFDVTKIKSVIDCMDYSSSLLHKFFNNNEINNRISLRKMDRKRYLLLNTSKKNQNELRTLWNEDTFILSKRKINLFYNIILKGKNIFLFNLLLFFIMLIKRIKNGNFTMKEYLTA